MQHVLGTPQHRYGDGKLVENFPSFGTTYSDISIESLSRATPHTSSFPQLKFSIFASVHGTLLRRPLLPFLATPFTTPSRLFRPTTRTQFPRSSFHARKLSR
ncbi:hypothetical protein PUN28_001718 [Cardiocondyla obscurior]|uniref:Uncharacterized protein n=1 Tax=Cardiocondyla obscurior TaxID=286306 RepID=A0AAW2GQX3_9HYME